jgi:hypothetical protein
MKPKLEMRPNTSGHQYVPPKFRKSRRGIWVALICTAVIAAAVVLLKSPGPTPAPEPEAVEVQMIESSAPATVAKKDKSSVANPVAPPAITAKEKPVDSAREAVPQVAETREDDAPVLADKFAGETPLLLTGTDATRDSAAKRDQELLHRAITTGAWDGYRKLLAGSIQGAVSKLPRGEGLNRFDPAWNEPVLYRALLRWKTLSSFSEAELRESIDDSYPADFMRWLLARNEAMEELLLTLQPADDSRAVLRFLLDAWLKNSENREKYFPLTVACAVVFDSPVAIPHPIGEGAQGRVDPHERYLWYVEKTEKGKLAAPVDRSSARDLIWVVCAPVSTSELEWAIRRTSGNRKKWGENYGKVKYLMERAVNGENPFKEYSFAEILKHGGICGDQSYFCANTARAQGIPAINLSGETNLGPHAWVGIKLDVREWTTGIGRVGGVSKGQAHNPQTGKSITEQEILQWNDRQQQSPIITLNVWRHLWLADLFATTGQDDENAETIRLANRLGPSFTETWQALYALLESGMQLTGDPAKPSNLDEWKAFAKDMRREFKDNPRMAELAAKAEMEYIFPYGDDGDAKRALLRERRRIERDSGEQADLIAGSLKREADLIRKLGGPDVKRDIARIYDRALRDYGGSITGFKIMAEDYFNFMRDDPESARKAARDVELAFKRVVETGSTDWFRANTESSIYRMICGYYRAAGDKDRAEMLEKRHEILLRRAKRSAL